MKTITINGVQLDCPFADLLPPPSAEELAGLEVDIRNNGVLQNVICAKRAGRDILIDGHNRATIAAKCGKSVPVCYQDYPSEEAMRQHALDLNLNRRHLTREEKQRYLTEALKDAPEQSNSAIAARVGVSDKTVAAKRAELEATSEIPKLPATVGKDGKKRKKPVARKKQTCQKPVTPAVQLPPPAEQLPGGPEGTCSRAREPGRWYQHLNGLYVYTLCPAVNRDLPESMGNLIELMSLRGHDRDPAKVRAFVDRLRDVSDRMRAGLDAFEQAFFAFGAGTGGVQDRQGHIEEVAAS